MTDLTRFIPRGWRLLDSRICSCGDEAFVLCTKSDDRPHDTNFVTWEVNLRDGGCYHGHYDEHEDVARLDLQQRFDRHERRA